MKYSAYCVLGRVLRKLPRILKKRGLIKLTSLLNWKYVSIDNSYKAEVKSDFADLYIYDSARGLDLKGKPQLYDFYLNVYGSAPIRGILEVRRFTIKYFPFVNKER